MNRVLRTRSIPFMLRFTKKGILVERAVIQSLLNVFFEDPLEPEAVICVDTSDAEHPRIYSAVRA